MCLQHAQRIVFSSPDFKKKVNIVMDISWIIFLFPYDVIIHNEHIKEFWSDSKGSILQHEWAACDESCSYIFVYL